MRRAVSAQAIDALLPQTQCCQCGYAGCQPYAAAIARGTAPINQCPPGGSELIAELALLLDTAAPPLNKKFGITAAPAVAVIDEALCIGCTLCLPACPVDAIVGARRMMHTVISAECTGCGLCLPPCPVDCISVLPTGAARDYAAQRAAAPRLRERFDAHRKRLSQRKAADRLGKNPDAAARKRARLERVMARARARLGKTAG